MRSLAGLVLLVAGYFVGCDESKHAYYATGAEALRDGAFARGWLPGVLTADASEIHESHDLDSNHGFADFLYRPELIPQLEQQCTSAPAKSGCKGYRCGAFTISLDPGRLSGHLSY